MSAPGFSERRQAVDELRQLAKRANEPGGFIPLASALRRIKDTDSGWFAEAYEGAGIKRRRAFALVKIDEVFGGGRVPEDRLTKIGWSKLMQISTLADQRPEKLDEFLGLAERLSARELEIWLDSGQALRESRTVTLTLTPEDYEKLEKALIRFGATPSGRGLTGKEQALVKLIEATAESGLRAKSL